MRKDAASIVQKIHGAEKLFQPTDNYTDFLKHVPPSFTAHFECQEYEKEPVKLEVEMLSSASDPGIYDRTSNTWSRLGQRDNNSPLNMFMIRLDGYVYFAFTLLPRSVLIFEAEAHHGSFRQRQRIRWTRVESHPK